MGRSTPRLRNFPTDIVINSKNGDQTVLDIYDEQEFMYEYISEYGSMDLEKLSIFFQNMCYKQPSPKTNDYTESGVGDLYIYNVLNSIYNLEGKVKDATEHRLFVTINNDTKIKFMDRIVNLLVYKTGCKGLASAKGVDENKIIHYTIICQNKSQTVIIGSRSPYIVLSHAFINSSKDNGYSYIILEVASSYDYNQDIKKRIPKYGQGASMHLIVKYATLGFVEDPRVALNYKCFDKNYPYNSMILDLSNVDTRIMELTYAINMLSGLQSTKPKEYKKLMKELGSGTNSYEEKHLILHKAGLWKNFKQTFNLPDSHELRRSTRLRNNKTINGGRVVCKQCKLLKR
jgi:hypothetical protein